MSEVEVFLDDTPGEVRGVVARDGQFERLISQRETDPAPHRLGAVSVARIARVEGAFKAAFVLKIIGSHPAVMGLPLPETVNLLAGAGWRR